MAHIQNHHTRNNISTHARTHRGIADPRKNKKALKSFVTTEPLFKIPTRYTRKKDLGCKSVWKLEKSLSLFHCHRVVLIIKSGVV